MKIAIVACVHGNELLGKEIVKILEKANAFSFFLANKRAMMLKRRFIDEDLNRCFPGDENGNHEERLAVKLLEKLKDFDFVIDIHSTTAETESFAIITRKEARKLAQHIPLNKIVFMEKTIAGGKALISNVSCGVSIEFNEKISPEKAANLIFDTVENIRHKRKNNQEQYSAYGFAKKKSIKLENFKKTTLDGETFYPILYGEREYKNILCMKARLL